MLHSGQAGAEMETPVKLPDKSPPRQIRVREGDLLKADSSSHGAPSTSAPFQVAGLALIAAPIFFFKLGTGALLDWDEAIYAEVSKEMVRGHHWLTPYWQHGPFFSKAGDCYSLACLDDRQIRQAVSRSIFWLSVSRESHQSSRRLRGGPAYYLHVIFRGAFP